MKIRYCDYCKKPIEPNCNYFSINLAEYSGRFVKYCHIRDMCLACEQKFNK